MTQAVGGIPKIEGDLTIESAESLRAQMVAAHASGVLPEFGEIGYVDLAGLQVLLAADRAFSSRMLRPPLPDVLAKALRHAGFMMGSGGENG